MRAHSKHSSAHSDSRRQSPSFRRLTCRRGHGPVEDIGNRRRNALWPSLWMSASTSPNVIVRFVPILLQSSARKIGNNRTKVRDS